MELNPDAPERLRVSAWRQIQQLKSVDEGTLEDVHRRMGFSRRRLETAETGDVTQEQQKKIVMMLAKLIKEQEKKECSNCSGSCKNSQQQGESKPSDGQGQAQNQGKSSTGGASQNPNGVVRRSFHKGPVSPWSRLRERSRDAANSAIKEKLPVRYRNVVERYYAESSGNKDDSQK